MDLVGGQLNDHRVTESHALVSVLTRALRLRSQMNIQHKSFISVGFFLFQFFPLQFPETKFSSKKTSSSSQINLKIPSVPSGRGGWGSSIGNYNQAFQTVQREFRDGFRIQFSLNYPKILPTMNSCKSLRIGEHMPRNEDPKGAFTLPSQQSNYELQ